MSQQSELKYKEVHELRKGDEVLENGEWKIVRLTHYTYDNVTVRVVYHDATWDYKNEFAKVEVRN